MSEIQNEYCYLNSPVGWLRVAADGAGLTSIDFIQEPPKSVAPISHGHLKEAYKQLSEYFRGERLSFNLPLNPKGTAFQRTVWRGLADIPFGTTVSYGELAARVGCPKGARAVGMANNRNPLPIVVPCHRVIGANGDMVGYGLGIATKKTLLEIEGADLKDA